MNTAPFTTFDEKDSRRLVLECFRREAGSSVPIPADGVDLIETGVLDSMAWVSFLRAVETASGVSDLGSALNDLSASLAAVMTALHNSRFPVLNTEDLGSKQEASISALTAVITGTSVCRLARHPR